jgi:putative phage-type endonuclease
MTATTIPITSREQWLAERAQDVTSTEVAALYGLSPYVTEFELWHRKRDRVVEETEPDERVRWGVRLQDAIAAGVAEDRNWKMRRLDVYMRDPEQQLGSSFDFEAVDPELGTGLAEIKNVDRSEFYDKWLDEPAGLQAPQHIELQAQVQMEVADLPWCAIVALIGGNDARVTVRMRDRQIGQHIRGKVRAFWCSVAAGTPPKPDYNLDAEFLCRLHGRADRGVTITADAELEQWLARYVAIGEIEKERKALKARVFERTTASRIVTPFGTFSCGEVAATEDRSAFRQLRFTPNRTKP